MFHEITAQYSLRLKKMDVSVHDEESNYLRRISLPQRKTKMDVLARWARERWLAKVQKDVSKDIRECTKIWLARSMERIEKYRSEGKDLLVGICFHHQKERGRTFTGEWMKHENGDFEKGHACVINYYNGEVIYTSW